MTVPTLSPRDWSSWEHAMRLQHEMEEHLAAAEVARQLRDHHLALLDSDD